MAISPFLSMLLSRKRNDPSTLTADDQSQAWDERLPSGQSSIGPTIPIKQPLRFLRSPATQNPDTGNSAPALAQQPTAPVSDGSIAPTATIPLKARVPATDASMPPTPPDWQARIEADRQRVIDAQNKPHSKWKALGEGIADWAASGVGIPLHKIMHPQGSETQQAQRQLATDLGLQKTQTENQDTQATIKLHRAQANKIQNEIDDPDTSDERKAELELLKEGLRTHPGPFDPSNPDDADFIKRLAVANYPINVATYGKQPKEATPIFREAKQSDGSVLTKKSVDGGKTWETVPDLTSEAPEKEVPSEVPDTSQGFATLEASHRKNAANAQTAADKAEADVKKYIADQKFANSSFDEKSDPNVASMTAEARRQRTYAIEQLKAADSVASRKAEAAAIDARERAKQKKPKLKASSIGVRPAKDGKYHYTPAQIRASLQAGQTYEDIYAKLKARPNVIIDEQ